MSLTEQAIELDGVTLRVHVTGDGPTIVFVHGVWVAGPLWDDVVQRLDGMRCIVPTWPLGAHADPAPAADLSARATARRIPELLETLDLRDVTLVGNDTGGGLCLAALGTQHPGLQRIGRLVLTNCDSYEHFPPKGFDTMVALMRRSPGLGFRAAALLRIERGPESVPEGGVRHPPADRCTGASHLRSLRGPCGDAPGRPASHAVAGTVRHARRGR